MGDVYDRVDRLVERIKESGAKEASEDLESIERYLRTGAEYYNAVITAVTTIKISSFRLEDPDVIRYRIENTDRTRRIAHQDMTRAVNMLNAYARAYESEPIFNVNRELDDESKDDRDLAAVLMYRFTTEVYLDEMVRTNYLVKEDTYKAVDDALSKMEKDAIKFDEARHFEDAKTTEEAQATEALDMSKPQGRRR